MDGIGDFFFPVILPISLAGAGKGDVLYAFDFYLRKFRWAINYHEQQYKQPEK